MERPTFDFFVGIDWAMEVHAVCVVDASGQIIRECMVEHSGDSLAAFIEWLEKLSEHQLHRIAVAIETPRGGLVEMLCDRAIAVYHLNPKQLDRFRDRHTMAGAKDDDRDAYVLGDSLRTDFHLFRRVNVNDPQISELRALSRLSDELQEEQGRLSNRLREQIYRYFPQMLQLCPAADEPWLWDLLERVPTPQHARRTRRARITELVKKYRLRRFTAEDILNQLRQTPVRVGAGTETASRTHIRSLLPRLRLVHKQHAQVVKDMEAILEQLAAPEESAEGQKNEHRDAAIILSVPGIGIKVAATMLSEATQAIADRDLESLRKLSGQAPVTRRSGKRKVVVRRYACNPRLRQALYHAARGQSRLVAPARAMYAAHRANGQEHGRTLRSVGDQLLRVLIAMLRTSTLYQEGQRRGDGTPAPGAEHHPDAANGQLNSIAA